MAGWEPVPQRHLLLAGADAVGTGARRPRFCPRRRTRQAAADREQGPPGADDDGHSPGEAHWVSTGRAPITRRCRTDPGRRPERTAFARVTCWCPGLPARAAAPVRRNAGPRHGAPGGKAPPRATVPEHRCCHERGGARPGAPG
ncbi:hypothetical protein HBB16_03505 [Pseudonocardia sp. MCCB 268]|nr:hypothetical protein [Pseudonocardia cytotoxica]